MAGAELAIGSRGIMRIDVDQMSQNPGANQSTVRVLCRIRLSSGGPSGDMTGNCKRSLNGDVGYGPTSYTFENLYTNWFTVLDEWRDITHNSDGTKSIWVNFQFGPTITQNLGSGGTVGVGLTLTTISKVPNQSSISSVYYNTPSKATVSWNETWAPSYAPVNRYQVVWWAIETPGSPQYVNVDPSQRSVAIDLFGSNSGYAFQVAARNSYGWGERSAPWDARLANLPTAPRNVQIAFGSISSGSVTFSPPASIGSSAIQKYQLEWSPVETFKYDTVVLESTTSPINITGLRPGERFYVRVRAITAAGGGYWSTIISATAPSGPAVKVGTDWRRTVAYVKVGTVWKAAVPYVYINGQWRLASS